MEVLDFFRSERMVAGQTGIIFSIRNRQENIIVIEIVIILILIIKYVKVPSKKYPEKTEEQEDY